MTIAPTRLGDHRALVWSFFVVTPLQYYLIWTGWYGPAFIPVYVSIFLAIRTAGRRHGTLSRAHGDSYWGS